jgi:ATP-dependent helicase/nuclease subunit A
VKEVLESRRGHSRHGALAALDEVTEALDMRTLCHGWGDAVSRLANLDAMRAHAFAYAVSCRENGTGCSPSGLVSRFAELAGSAGDTQGIILDGDAVTVSTWHGAKGLEWPVTVLFELNPREKAKSALGAHMLSDREKIDLDDPLGGRWIRYWPEPYSNRNTKGPFYERLKNCPASQEEQKRTAFEGLRLLYVGWTRARDRLVLVSREGELFEGPLALLKNGDQPLVSDPNAKSVFWAGQEVSILVRRADNEAAVRSDPVAEEDYVSDGPRAYPPATINPSEAQEPAAADLAPAHAAAPPAQTASQVQTIGGRAGVSASSEDQWTILGTAIHTFLCADRDGLGAVERLALAEEILGRWGASGWIEPAALVQAGTALKDWIAREWPGAAWHREWPLLHRLPSGSVVRGTADLVLELPAGFVLIDHKSFPGSRVQAEARAASFAGQLELYGRAIEAAKGWNLLSAWIHLPVSGLAVRVLTV